jgi:hypothetical protein
MRILLLLLLLLLPTLSPVAVANRCKGEASFAIPECACTVLNRLDVGWAESEVLSAYYAPDAVTTSTEVEQVRQILSREATCDPALYFMYSRADTVNLGISQTPALIVRDGDREILFFSRWFKR